MKVVQSFWSKPYLKVVDGTSVHDRGKAGFLTQNLFLATWALSVLNLRKYFDEVELVTDSYGKRLLVDYLNLPYTSVSTGLDSMESYSTDLWAIGKLYAYNIQEKPFLHIDGDVFLWEQPSDFLLNAPLICQHVEVLRKPFIKLINATYNELDFVPHEMLEFRKDIGSPGMINAGVFGGNDINFIQNYTRKAFEFVNSNLHRLAQIDARSFNMIFEQYLFSCLVNYNKRSVTQWLDYEISENFLELVNFFMLPDQVAYTHLVSMHKKQLTNMEQVVLRLKNEHPAYYSFFSKLFGEEVYDINLKLVIPSI